MDSWQRMKGFGMPIYEYTCRSCGRNFECMQRITEPPIAPCPRCGATADRIISASSFSLKGGGWYKDGYTSGREKQVKGESSKVKGETKSEGSKTKT